MKMRLRCGRILATAVSSKPPYRVALTGKAAILAAAVATSAALPLLADTPEAVSADCTYAADTRPSPRAVRTAEELGEITGGTLKAAWRLGEIVTLVAPDGTETTLADGSSAGTATLALGAGGCWTLVNSRAGESEITVRYSLYGSAGSGTESDPLKVVDDDEIAAIDGETLTSGFHIALRGASDLDLSSLVLGSGLSLMGLGGGVWRVDAVVGGAEAVSAEKDYNADTLPSPRMVKTAEELSEITGGTWCATRRAGEAVALTSPGGTASVLCDGGNAVVTSVALPLDAGGLWTASNSVQGVATFTVRHSLYGTLGDGTVSSPAKLVDGDELVDYSAGDGYVFTLNGVESLVDALRLPSGLRLEKIDDAGAATQWRIVASAGGEEYVWAALAYSADTKQSGPDRRLRLKDVMPVAYSGDNWSRTAESASTLTLTAPSGAVAEYELTGTDALTVRFSEAGRWRIALAAGDRTLESTVNVTHRGIFIKLK